MDVHTKFDIGDYAYVKTSRDFEIKWSLVYIRDIDIFMRTSSCGVVPNIYYTCIWCNITEHPYTKYDPVYIEAALYTKEEKEKAESE